MVVAACAAATPVEDAPDDIGIEDLTEEDANVRSFALMRLAEVLRDDISPVACLSCSDDDADRNRAACPCFATLHPFCDLFHTWLCHRLIDDGAGTCCLLPAQVITDPELDADDELAAAVADAAALKPSQDQTDAAAGVIASTPGTPGTASVELPEAKADEASPRKDPDADCDATRFHTDSEHSDAERGERGGEDRPQQDVPREDASENEEGPTDPLTAQLRALTPTASGMVYSLEKNVGDLRAQKLELYVQLAECVELSTEGVTLALEEILEWYSVLSILACSFPTQRELIVQKKKAQRKEADASELEATQEMIATATAAAARQAESELADFVAANGIQPDAKAPSAEEGAAAVLDVDADGRSEAETADMAGDKEEEEEEKEARDAEHEAEACAEAAAEAAEESNQIINSSLDMPPLLLRSADIGQPLRPIFLGAASEKDAGQWFMGLQGLRESPAKSIEDLCERRWRTWQQSHCKYLLKVCERALTCAWHFVSLRLVVHAFRLLAPNVTRGLTLVRWLFSLRARGSR